MIQKNKRNIFEKLIFNQIAYFVIGFLILILISMPLSKKIGQRYQLNKEIDEFNKEIERMSSNNNDLKNLITYFESQEFTEEEARINLNLKKEGEEVVVIKNKDEKVLQTKINTKNNNELIKNQSNQIKWWNYFFN